MTSVPPTQSSGSQSSWATSTRTCPRCSVVFKFKFQCDAHLAECNAPVPMRVSSFLRYPKLDYKHMSHSARATDKPERRRAAPAPVLQPPSTPASGSRSSAQVAAAQASQAVSSPNTPTPIVSQASHNLLRTKNKLKYPTPPREIKQEPRDEVLLSSLSTTSGSACGSLSKKRKRVHSSASYPVSTTSHHHHHLPPPTVTHQNHVQNKDLPFIRGRPRKYLPSTLNNQVTSPAAPPSSNRSLPNQCVVPSSPTRSPTSPSMSSTYDCQTRHPPTSASERPEVPQTLLSSLPPMLPTPPPSVPRRITPSTARPYTVADELQAPTRTSAQCMSDTSETMDVGVANLGGHMDVDGEEVGVKTGEGISDRMDKGGANRSKGDGRLGHSPRSPQCPPPSLLPVLPVQRRASAALPLRLSQVQPAPQKERASVHLGIPASAANPPFAYHGRRHTFPSLSQQSSSESASESLPRSNSVAQATNPAYKPPPSLMTHSHHLQPPLAIRTRHELCPPPSLNQTSELKPTRRRALLMLPTVPLGPPPASGSTPVSLLPSPSTQFGHPFPIYRRVVNVIDELGEVDTSLIVRPVGGTAKTAGESLITASGSSSVVGDVGISRIL